MAGPAQATQLCALGCPSPRGPKVLPGQQCPRPTGPERCPVPPPVTSICSSCSLLRTGLGPLAPVAQPSPPLPPQVPAPCQAGQRPHLQVRGLCSGVGCTGADRNVDASLEGFSFGAYSRVVEWVLHAGDRYVQGVQLWGLPSLVLRRAPAQSVPTKGKHLPALSLLLF